MLFGINAMSDFQAYVIPRKGALPQVFDGGIRGG